MTEKRNLAQKILSSHLINGELKAGAEIGIRIDQTLTQDASGTTAYLLFEAIEIPRVRTELSVSYVDHNTPQYGPENHNDHLYLQSIASKIGAYYSRPGNGICHQVHLERFAKPGKTLLGSDSHTPTCGGMGMAAIGAGGLDVAVAMGGGAFYTTCPKVIGVELRGQLRPWVSAKDIILRLLSILTTRGNVSCVVEYFGPGVTSLPVPARATLANMGAELGVTSSIFPSDDSTRQFLVAQERGDDWQALSADEGATYDRITKKLHVQKDAAAIENIKKYCMGVTVVPVDGQDQTVNVGFDRIALDLGEIEPLAAAPSSPDNVVRIADQTGKKISQVVIGSCTNSSYQDLMRVAGVLKGRTVHPGVELGIAPGSRQVIAMLAANGALAELVRSGARILESACGPCIGLGFSPADGTVSLRTFNRNFAGRSGTEGDQVYLVSPETAVAGALTGQITDPRELEKEKIEYPAVDAPARFAIEDNMLQPPARPGEADSIEIVRGPSIVKPPRGEKIPDKFAGVALIKVGDKVTTDHIMPAGSLLKHRSNVPEYAKYVFNPLNEKGKPTFADRALAAKSTGKAGVIVAGDSYGQGSSREHAALCPMHLGVKIVLAKAIERIHQANLVNFGILPLTFANPADYDRIQPGDELAVEGLDAVITSGQSVTIRDVSQKCNIACQVSLAPRQRKILAADGLLNYTRQGGQ
jgi:aconitate hydratase